MELSKAKTEANYQWKLQGSLKDNSIEHEYHKECKHRQQAALRDVKRRYEINNIEDICNTNDIDQIFFWKLITKHKPHVKSIHPLKLEDNTVITDPEKIANVWKDYFQKLYGEDSNAKFNKMFATHVTVTLIRRY